MTEKLYTPVKHVRYDKTGGATDPSFYPGMCILIDKFGYSGSSLQELGILTALIKHGLLEDHVEHPLTPAQQALAIELKLMINGRDASVTMKEAAAAPST